MPGFDLPDESVWKIVSFLQRSPETTGRPEGGDALVATVDYDRIASPGDSPTEWLTYSGQYSGQRHSPLEAIDRKNVSNLRTAWLYQIETDQSVIEATPIVAGGMMFVSVPPAGVVALEAATGREVWRYQRSLRPYCCRPVNRGVAVLNDLVYFASIDAYLVALDMRSGRVVWDVQLGDSARGYNSTGAPLAIKDLVVTGIAGGDFGIRGFVDAYDARTGRRVWRFNTIPGPGEPGHETWAGESWRTGGGGSWMSGSYDPETNLVYWGVGNPGPDFFGDDRRGDNLYTDSLLALDATTGKLRWHFQFTPHDVHDWGAANVPMLLDLPWDGEVRKVVVSAPKNGFLYVLDRQTGEFLSAMQIARQNWATIGSGGLPVATRERDRAEKAITFPGTDGAANWFPASFNPATRLLHVPVREMGEVVVRRRMEYRPGQPFFGGEAYSLAVEPGAADEPSWRALLALDPHAGTKVWEVREPGGADDGFGGSLSTAGGVVFWGVGRDFSAFDAESGARLWSLNVGGQVYAAPMTFVAGGRQHVAVAAGRSIIALALPE
jgi:alcohol dehydrogenase (cytochrome c)